MRVIILLFFCIGLIGCQLTDFSGETAVSTIADLNDKKLAAAEILVCRGASMGAIMRRYNTPELMLGWQEFCLGANAKQLQFILPSQIKVPLASQ